MPSGNADIIKREIIVKAPADRVWARLADPRALCSLFTRSVAAKLEPDGAGGQAGKLRIDDALFKVRMRPYDALATAEGCRLALRLTPVSEEETRAVAAISITGDCGFSASEKELAGFLARLAQAASGGSGEARQDKKIYKSASRPAAQPEAESAPASGGEAPEEKSSKGRAWLAALGIIAAAAAAFAIWTFWPFGAAAHGAAPTGDLSQAVSGENFASLALGMSQSEVEALFETDGLKVGSGEYLYRGGGLNGQSQPLIQIKCEYADGKLASAAILYLENAQKIGALPQVPPDLSAYPASLVRRYIKDGEEYEETHIGYVDPFANFSPSWRGEAATALNKTTGTAVTSYLAGYDGSDPLMLDSLEGKPAAFQYDDYDAFLADKLAFDEARLIVNGYSRGDVVKIFGECEEYDAGSGVKLYRARKGAPDEGGEPIYTYSFRYDSTGAFELGSFSNKRLYTAAGAFAGCKPAEVGPGQSYGEVRYLMPIVPTALFVNDNFYTVCYGRYTGGSEIKYQFELVVSFDIETNAVETVYDNRIEGSAGAA